ncbi:hypothetical protein J6590_104965, partial [Homalodisca vitripennis]
MLLHKILNGEVDCLDILKWSYSRLHHPPDLATCLSGNITAPTTLQIRRRGIVRLQRCGNSVADVVDFFQYSTTNTQDEDCRRSWAKEPSLTFNLETNGLKMTSEPPSTAGQPGCLQGQDRSAVTHQCSSHARRCFIRLSCGNRCTRCTTPLA